MRKIYIYIIIISMMPLLAGCKNPIRGRIEINDLELIREVGIDKSPNKDGYVQLSITARSTKTGSISKTDEKEKQIEVILSEGKTVFDAVRNFDQYLDKKAFWGHVEFILIGEEAAKEGIQKYTDYFTRDHEIRLNLKVFVVKGCRADELIQKGNTKNEYSFDRLKSLIKAQEGQSVSTELEISKMMHILDLKFLSLSIPTVELVNASSSEQNKKLMYIKMGGFAIFDDDRLTAYIDDNEARGLNWLMNRVGSGTIVVSSSKGSNVSLEIIKATVKKIPTIVDGELAVTIKIQVLSNIIEIESTEDVFNSKTIEYLNTQQAKKVKEEVESILRFAQEKHVDFFDMGLAVFRKYPIAWQDIYEKDWKSTFSKLKIGVVVDAKINNTYDIREPSGYKKGE